jgi:predicted transcriptional regulator
MTGRSFYFDPHATGSAVFLGPTEARLMELAWDKKELTVKKTLFYLGSDDQPAYTTVMTVLSRLADKGFLKRKKSGRVFVYRPAIDRKTFISNHVKVVRECLKKNFGK